MTNLSRRQRGNKRQRRGRQSAPRDRSGVASVLAMMFLVIFGSLAATMGIVAQGNLRTAQTHLQVSRALAAAEAGMDYAERRLEKAVQRFVLDRGEITEELAMDLWMGTYDSMDGTIVVREPDDFSEATPARGIAEALANAHGAEAHQVYGKVPNDDDLPFIDQATGQLVTRPIGFDYNGEPNFQVLYTPLADARYVRVTVIGRDADVERAISVDYQLAKRLKYAIMSPNRIMLGKNVHVQGSIGSSYSQLDVANGHPLISVSDFAHLSSSLDSDLQALQDNLPLYDVDGDGRFRVGHSVESQGVPGDAYDVDGDGYVDEFDLFMAEYDTINTDAKVVYDSDLAAAAGHPGLSEEFDVDPDLAVLLDQTFPDRNRDGEVNDKDVALGYNDGLLDRLDNYAKVHGSFGFTVSAQAWADAQGGNHWQRYIHGAMKPDRYDAAVEFSVPEHELLELDAADFTESQDGIAAIADAGQDFQSQVDAQIASGGEYIAPSDATWERVPWRSPGFYDWYQRPIYRNMTFKNVVIPRGNNGLFENCTFIGATKIECYSDNTHVNWNYYGTKEKAPDGTFHEKYEILDKEDVPPGDEGFYANYDELPEALYIDGVRVRDTKPWSNNIRFHDCEIRGSVVTTATTTFTHVRNKVQFTGGTVFVEPSVGGDGGDGDADVTQEEYDALKRSSLMAPGYSVDIGTFNSPASQDVNLRGTIISGVLDIRGNASIVGSLLMTYSPVVGEGALAYGGNPAGFNSTFGYFGPDDGDGESMAPHTLTDTDGDGVIDVGEDYDGDGIADPWQGYAKINIIYDPDIPLPDGLMTPLQVVLDPLSYREGL
jgi:hypothetical protein